MKVSIITATYNSADTIVETLKSLEQQTYRDIEYIVVDGGSKDNTLDIIKENSSKITHIISEPDKGIYDALNKGIKIATGDIIGFLHSDDVFSHPNVIKDLVNILTKNNTDAVYADLQYVNRTNINTVIRLWKSGVYERDKIKKGWMPPHPTFYMKRSCYEKFGLFDLTFNISADYESILRFLWKNNISISYLPKVIIKMRVGGESNRNLRSIIIKTKEDIQALKRNNVPWFQAVTFKNLSKIPQFFKR